MGCRPFVIYEGYVPMKNLIVLGAVVGFALLVGALPAQADPLADLLASSPYAAIVPYYLFAVMLCSAVDASFPQPQPGSHWLLVRKLVSLLALNFGRASNVEQPSFMTWLVRMLQPLLPAVQRAVVPAPGAGDPVQGGTGPGVAVALLMICGMGLALSACTQDQLEKTQAIVTAGQADIAVAGQTVAQICALPATQDLLQSALIQPNVASDPNSTAGSLLAQGLSACTVDGKVAASLAPNLDTSTPVWLGDVLHGLSIAAELAPYVLPLL